MSKFIPFLSTDGKSLEGRNSILAKCIWFLSFTLQVVRVERMRDWFKVLSEAFQVLCLNCECSDNNTEVISN
jgi:hypothetical protein